MGNHCIVITTINQINDVLNVYARECYERDYDLVIVGDKKTPSDCRIGHRFFYDVEEQMALNFSYPAACPFNHYARKNVGYLIAMARGAELIVDTDDDNFPKEGFWTRKNQKVSTKVVLGSGSEWVNVYSFFSDKKIWPRGYPLELVNMESQYEYSFMGDVDCPIQQGLVDEDPDIDAVYRLTGVLPIYFESTSYSSIALGKNLWSPFNSQNTNWWRDAFPLLYLPAYCSFRMTDIWRSFVAQRICWENGWSILFTRPTAYQIRNQHSLIKDFRDEIPGYLNNFEIAVELGALDLKSGKGNIPENMMRCYELLVHKLKVVGQEELKLLQFWLTDIDSL